MNKIYKYLLAIALGLSICSCGLFRKVPKDNNNVTIGTPSMFGQTMMINSRQLDSVCVADGLSLNLDEWISTTYQDYETNEQIKRYAYIKVLGENEEMTYILTPVDTLYKLTKRFVKEMEETE